MSHLTIGVVVFACVFGAGLVGLFVHSRLPKEFLESDSKEFVRLAMGLVGTTVALVLGLLIASSKDFYATQNTEVTQLAADVVFLDKTLNQYGPETKEMRDLLRRSVVRMLDVTWKRDNADRTSVATFAESEALLHKDLRGRLANCH